MLAITMVGGHVSCPIPIRKFVILLSNNYEWLPRKQIISIKKHQTRHGASCDEWLLHRTTLFRQLQGPFQVAVRSKKAPLRILPNRASRGRPDYDAQSTQLGEISHRPRGKPEFLTGRSDAPHQPTDAHKAYFCS